MVQKQQTNIGLDRDKHRLLTEKKRAAEAMIGRRLYWGDFLLILAGLWEEEQARRGQSVRMEQGEPAPEEDLEEIPIASRADVEEIVKKQADRVIRELRSRKR
jgi:hypothetical protein